MSNINPLRYPGGKAKLVNYIQDLIIDQNLSDAIILEPYAGSASVSLSLLGNNVLQNAILVERDPLIYAFWYSVFNHCDELIEKINTLQITLDTWNDFLIYKSDNVLNKYNIVDIGLSGLFFNRTSFSGILKAGPIGGFTQSSKYKIDCRFNKFRIINQIQQLSELQNRITICYDDALNFFRTYRPKLMKQNIFVYIDPPYYEKGPSLYRYWYKHNDHKNLSKFIQRFKKPWLISYDDHKEIRNLYRNSTALQPIYFDYSIAGSRKGKELLISNLEIPPFSQILYENNLA